MSPEMRDPTVDQAGRDKAAARKPLGADAYWQLMYLGLMVFDPIFRRVSALEWAVTLGGIAIFLPLYFRAWRTAGRRKLVWIAAIAALGVVVAPFNFGAFGYHIYAMALLAHGFRPWVAIRGLVLLLALVAVESWILGLPRYFWIFGGVFTLIVGIGQMYYGERTRQNARLRRTQEEVERLAKTAERERIARDLHDLLGHTLSLVTLKAELAARLATRDPERAGREMREVERIAREALSEVREAVTGYRAADLATARVQAELALEVAGVHLDWQGEMPELPGQELPGQELPGQLEHVLALALREAVTNVVRHARALTCRVSLSWHDGRVELEVADDGRGGTASGSEGGIEGSGLAGMRERVEALGGTVERRSGSAARGGTRVRVVLPLAHASSTVPAPAEPASEPSEGTLETPGEAAPEAAG